MEGGVFDELTNTTTELYPKGSVSLWFMIFFLMFADDTALVADNEEGLKVSNGIWLCKQEMKVETEW